MNLGPLDLVWWKFSNFIEIFRNFYSNFLEISMEFPAGKLSHCGIEFHYVILEIRLFCSTAHLTSNPFGCNYQTAHTFALNHSWVIKMLKIFSRKIINFNMKKKLSKEVIGIFSCPEYCDPRFDWPGFESLTVSNIFLILNKWMKEINDVIEIK